MELIKPDCLAVIRARCGQALAMVVRPHLLCQGEKERGGGATAGWPLTQSREPRAKPDSCHGRGRRPAIISFTHMVYESAETFLGELCSTLKCLQIIYCKFIYFFLIWAFFVITKFFVRSFEIVFTSQNKKGLKCQEIVITYVHQHRLQINFSILRNLIWYNKPTSTFTDTFIFTCYHLAIILPSYDYFHTAHINFNWLKGWLFFSFLYTSKLKSNAILKMKKV